MGYKILDSGQAPAFLKIIAAGAAGGGKTRFCIDGGSYTITKEGTIKGAGEVWPDLLIINAEGGVPAYEEPFEGQFRVVHTADIFTLSEIVEDIKNKKVICDTLAIDTWTTFRNIVRDAEEKKSGKLEMQQFGRINRAMTKLQNNLAQLPCHVILVIHESDIIEQNGNNATRKAGVSNNGMKLEANKNIAQWADFILWFEPRKGGGSLAAISKARGTYLGENEEGMLKNPSWKSTFKPVAERWARRAGEKGSAPAIDYAAAEKGATKLLDQDNRVQSTPKQEAPKNSMPSVMNFTNKSAAARWYQQQMDLGWTQEDLLAALSVKGLGELAETTFDEANALLKTWADSKIQPEGDHAA
jgi:hypothetical protein